MSQLRKNTVEFIMARKILQVNTQIAQKSSKAQHKLEKLTDCVVADHEINIATIAEELEANSEGFPTCGHGTSPTTHQRDHPVQTH